MPQLVAPSIKTDVYETRTFNFAACLTLSGCESELDRCIKANEVRLERRTQIDLENEKYDAQKRFDREIENLVKTGVEDFMSQQENALARSRAELQLAYKRVRKEARV